MAKQIYSFTKIEKRRTKAGPVSMVMGIASIVVLIGLLTAATIRKGDLQMWAAGICLCSLLLALCGLYMTDRAKKDDDRTGELLTTGFVICLVAFILHLLVAVAGVLAMIS